MKQITSPLIDIILQRKNAVMYICNRYQVDVETKRLAYPSTHGLLKDFKTYFTYGLSTHNWTFLCPNFYSDNPMSSRFCTRHENLAVLASAKL